MTSRRSPLFHQLIRAAILAAGFSALWLVLVGVLGSVAVHELRVRRNPQPSPRDWEELLVTTEGTPVIATNHGNRRNCSYRRVDGQPLADVPRLEPQPAVVGLRGTKHPTGIDDFFGGQKLDWTWRLKAFVDDQHPELIWYFVHDGKERGGGYFVGYDRSNNQRIGFIGESGFSTRQTPTDQFIPVRSLMARFSRWSSVRLSIAGGRVQSERSTTSPIPSRLVYVPSGNRIRLVDLSARTVRTVFETPERIEDLAVFTYPLEAHEQPSERAALVVRTTGKIHVLNRENRVIRAFSIPSEDERGAGVVWYELGNGKALAVLGRSRWQVDHYVPTDVLYWIKPDGTTRDGLELVLRNRDVKWTEKEQGVLLPWAVPVPAVLPIIQPLLMVLNDDADNYASGFPAMLQESWLSLAAVSVVALMLAGLAWRQSSLFALPMHERITWAIFVSLFGIPGYVGYLLHRRWPLRTRCPHCGIQSHRQDGACAACRTPFAGPVVKGIEIFA